MIVFFHFHKAAGSTLVASAIDSGLRPPPKHANGHPLDDDGQPVVFAGKDFAWTRQYFDQMREQGVQFLAIEWWFPPLEYLLSISGLRLCTIIREPFQRAVSNYLMDIREHYMTRRIYSFRDYFDGSAPFRTDNYYIREICGSYGLDCRVTGEQIRYASRFLASMHGIGILKGSNLYGSLDGVGLRIPKGRRENFHDHDAFSPALVELFGTDKTEQWQWWFVERNLSDYFLFQSTCDAVDRLQSSKRSLPKMATHKRARARRQLQV